ncbi:Ribosomal protein S6 kinase-like 1 [Larimichthys crocea]|uniref:Uncharacterized protein n=1 Tax=Larimichthys crocea TaxID=215358 RepID=A0ACD3RPL0_LARCR|nr:Ribosomal protein S6 kinase-like 1 [Larimichthys crocea]
MMPLTLLLFFPILSPALAWLPMEDWESGNVTTSADGLECFCSVFLPDSTFPADRVQHMQQVTIDLKLEVEIQMNKLVHYRGKLDIFLGELMDLTVRVAMMEGSADDYIKLDFELLRIELREFEALVSQLKDSLNSSSPMFESLYTEIHNMTLIVNQLETIDKNNLEVIRIEFAKLQKKLEECQKEMEFIKPDIGNCNHTGIMSISKPTVIQINAHLNTGYQYGGWGKDSKPVRGYESMHCHRQITKASERFSYTYSPKQYLDFSADEKGLWVMYATEESMGKIVVAKIDEKSFGIKGEWTTNAFKPLAGNAFMVCGVMYATRPGDLQTEEIYYSYNTETGEEKYMSIPLQKFQEKFVNLHYNPTDQRLYMYNNGYYVSYNGGNDSPLCCGWSLSPSGTESQQTMGYSSLRFRPIRHLSSPVEDLEMCKVVGVTDKVLIVQSMVNKETFVVKSLVKSSWESRDRPTIIPQGVPYMVKLLRYYVSEDAVYLHLEHVKGGRLFSKLHKLRTEKAKEHPECFTSGQHSVKLKTSYTSPTISTDYQHNSRGSTGVIPEKLNDENTDTDFPNSWDETQQRLESCGTHSYIEETGCLQNTRSAASFYNKLDRLTLHSGSTRTQVNTCIHPPAPSLCLHSSETQEQPALPLSCARVSQALDVMSELHTKKAVMGLTECSSEFEVAWKAADPAQNGEKINPYAVTDSHSHRTLGQTPPHTIQTSFIKAGSPNSENNGLSSSPAILHLPLHCQTQIRGRASWDTNGSQQVSVLSSNCVDMVTDTKQDSGSPHHRGKKWNGAPLDNSGGKYKEETLSSVAREGVEVACELSPREKVAPAKERSFLHPTGQERNSGAFLKSDGSEGQGEDQIIEVDGWCHLPRFPVKSSPADKAMQTCWGLPEAEVRVWGAQILLALESLHQQGILCRDLNPRNVLLTSNGKVCLTFFGQWSEVQSEICFKAMEQMYCAPEIGGVSRVTEACDWWSLGALLFELLTGMPLWQLHPAGIHSHTQLLIPDHLSTAAASLLTELLQFDAGYRLGSGGGGVSDIKCHPFFSSISWKALSC